MYNGLTNQVGTVLAMPFELNDGLGTLFQAANGGFVSQVNLGLQYSWSVGAKDLVFDGDLTIDNGVTTIALRGNEIATSSLLNISPSGLTQGKHFLDSASVATADATVTTIYSFVPTNNSAVRVVASVVGNGTLVNCSFGKIATFKSVAGVVSAVGAAASIGPAEENAGTDITIDTDGTNIRVRVTGIAATNMNWTAHVEVFY